VANALATIFADVFNAKLIVNAAGSDPNSRHVDCS